MIIKVLRIKVSSFCALEDLGKLSGTKLDDLSAPFCAWVCVQIVGILSSVEVRWDQASSLTRSSMVMWLVPSTCLSPKSLR